MGAVHDAEEPSFAAKIEFLSRASSYPDRPSLVDCVETHFAHVFLSRHFAYKIKKPFKYRQIDFSDIEGRRRSCELEVVLNRRLAAPTYLGVVPLASAAGGVLALEGAGEPVDWLVKMRRLPTHRVLEKAALEGRASDDDLRAVVEKLVRFYRTAPVVPWTPREYGEHLMHRTSNDAAELLGAGARLEAGRIARIRDAQLEFLHARADLVERRAAEGRVVDAHGDLRPEHIFLNGDPQIIDCLEFSEELRWLDAAEEISFLALELERVGASGVARRLEALYLEVADDGAPPPLLLFYRSARALVRALLCAWRIVELDDERSWRARAEWYLAVATRSLGVAG
jgi:aminoglycoside phosphotransferase family enzyme